MIYYIAIQSVKLGWWEINLRSAAVTSRPHPRPPTWDSEGILAGALGNSRVDSGAHFSPLVIMKGHLFTQMTRRAVCRRQG